MTNEKNACKTVISSVVHCSNARSTLKPNVMYFFSPLPTFPFQTDLSLRLCDELPWYCVQICLWSPEDESLLLGERLTFPVQPPAGLHLWSIVKYPDKCCMDCHEFCCRCSRTLSNKYVIVGTDMHGPKRRNCNNWTNWPANSSIESRYSCTETIAWQWTFKPNVNGFKCVHLTVFVNMFACGSRNQTWSWMLRD